MPSTIQPSCQNKHLPRTAVKVPRTEPGIIRSLIAKIEAPVSTEFESKFIPVADYKNYVDFLRKHSTPERIIKRVINDHEKYYAQFEDNQDDEDTTAIKPKLPKFMEEYDGITNESTIDDWVKFYRMSGFSEEFIDDLYKKESLKMEQVKSNIEFIDSIMGKYSGKVTKKKVKKLREKFKENRKLVKVDDSDIESDEDA